MMSDNSRAAMREKRIADMRSKGYGEKAIMESALVKYLSDAPVKEKNKRS